MSEAAEAVDVAKRIVDKKRLCELLKWSRMRLDRRLEGDPGFPIETVGTQAGGWSFDYDAVLEHLGASTFEDGGDDEDPGDEPQRVTHRAEHTARSRLNDAQAQLAEDKLRERRGQLVEAQPLALALSETVTTVTTSLNSLPDILVRRLKLPDVAAGVIREEIDEIRRAMVLSLRKQLGV